MGHEIVNQNFLFTLLPAFKVGVNDAINPCGFATVLVFIYYLSAIGYTQKRVFWFGLLFILSSVAAHFGLTIGFFDPIVTSSLVLLLLRAFYFLLTSAFLVLGVLNIMDRWQYEKYSDVRRFRCKVPAFLKDLENEKPYHKIKTFLVIVEFILLALVVGILVTVCSSLYPQREYIFIVHSYLMAGGNGRFAFASFFQYAVASTWPLVVAWAAVLCLNMARKKKKAILYYKTILSALFLSVGVGLGYFLLSS